jgi:hypothetical protein
MAELLRIPFVRKYDDWDNGGWGYAKTKGIDFIVCTHEQLQIHFDVPDELKKMDVVLHSHPSQDRLNGRLQFQYDGKENDSFVQVEVISCYKRWIVRDFPCGYLPSLSTMLTKWMKKTGRKTGDKVYVQIEY